jgi:hypothetical protein
VVNPTNAHAPTGNGPNTSPQIVDKKMLNSAHACGTTASGRGTIKFTTNPTPTDAASGTKFAPFHTNGVAAALAFAFAARAAPATTASRRRARVAPAAPRALAHVAHAPHAHARASPRVVGSAIVVVVVVVRARRPVVVVVVRARRPVVAPSRARASTRAPIALALITARIVRVERRARACAASRASRSLGQIEAPSEINSRNCVFDAFERRVYISECPNSYITAH